MSLGFGYNSWIGIATETTFNTPVAPAKFLEVQEISLKGKQTIISRPSLRRFTPEHNVKSKKSVEGGFKFQFPFDGVELFLKHAFGTVTTTGGAAPYQHVFTSAASLPTGLTITANRDASNIGGSSCFQYSGCMINKISFSQAMEDFLMVSIDAVGADWSLVALPTPTFPTFVGCAQPQLTTATIGGAAVKISDWEINMDNALADDRYYLLSQTRKGFGRKGQMKVDGKMTLEFESLTEYNYYKNLTNQAIQLIYTGGTLGAGTYLLQFDIPKAYFNGNDPEVKDAGPIMLELGFEAYMNSADGDALSVTLKNNVASVTG